MFFFFFCLDFYQTHPAPNAALNLNRASANAVSGAGQNVTGPLAGAQGTAGVPQGTLQQATQQPQTITPMAIALTQPGNIFYYFKTLIIQCEIFNCQSGL